jgi:hypothetical protein
MIAQLKYGSGMPFYRLEQLEGQLGIPLPAATQWEIAEEAAELLKRERDELIRQAAQGEVVHNDDTSKPSLMAATSRGVRPCTRWNMMNADWPERPWTREDDATLALY